MGSLVAGGGYGLFVFIRVFYPPRQPSHDMPEVSHQHSPAATPKCLKAFLHFYGFIYIFIYLFYSGAALWHWAEQSTGRPGLVMVPPPQTHTPLSFSPSLPSSHSLSLSLCSHSLSLSDLFYFPLCFPLILYLFCTHSLSPLALSCSSIYPLVASLVLHKKKPYQLEFITK